MKKEYHLADDIFMCIAFISFMVGGTLNLVGISPIKLWTYTLTSGQLIQGAVVCLFFSIALSLREVAHITK